MECDIFKHDFSCGLGKFRVIGDACTVQFCDFIRLSRFGLEPCSQKEREFIIKGEIIDKSGLVLKIDLQHNTTYEVQLSGRITGNHNKIGYTVYTSNCERLSIIKQKPLPISNNFGPGHFIFRTPMDHKCNIPDNHHDKNSNCTVNIIIYLKCYSKICSKDTNVCTYTCTSPPNNNCIRPNNVCVPRLTCETPKTNDSNMLYLHLFSLKKIESFESS